MTPLYRLGCRIYQKIFWLFSFLLPFREPEIIEGENSLLRLPAWIKEKKLDTVMVVTDKGLIALGLLDPLFSSLKQAGIQYVLYDKTVENPTIDNIEEALRLYHERHCQGLVAVGGGSSMDLAKGVGARVARPKKTIPKMKGVLKVIRTLPPVFVVPTTAGTGSEATLAAIITDSVTHEKYAINDPVLIPRYAVLDPVITAKLPKHITATTGIDALTHAVEAFIGHSNTKKTEHMAIEATKLIFANLKKAYDDGSDLTTRKNMQKAAYMAGVAFTRAYVGNVHAIAHTLGGFYQVPHGLANSVILPYILEYYGKTAWHRLSILADAAQLSDGNDSVEIKAKKFIQAIKELNRAMNIPNKIVGVIQDKDIPTMVDRAFMEANPLYPVPKIMSRADMENIYRLIKS
jgi:Alcohol dehydrogenase, class IV